MAFENNTATNMITTLFRKSVCTAMLGLTTLAANASDYATALQRFNELATTRMPQIGDAGVAEVLDTLSDHKRFLDTKAFAISDMPQLMEMCGQANQVAIAYMLSDLKSHVDPSMRDQEKIAAIVMQVSAANITKYQNEMVPVLAFNLKCMAKEVPLLASFVRTLKPEELTSVRLKGVQQVRNGLLNTYLGTAKSVSETAISLENRRKLFLTLAETTPVYAQTMDLQRRQAALNYWRSQANAMPAEFQAPYKQIVAALASTECDDFCRLPEK